MSSEEASALASALSHLRWSRATEADRKATGARLTAGRKAARLRRIGAGKRSKKAQQTDPAE